MKVNKFQILTETLRTDLIIFIDNDFTPITKSQEILSFITLLNEIDFSLLRKRLKEIDADLEQLINEYRQNLSSAEFDEDDQTYIESGLIIELLKQKGYAELEVQAQSISQRMDEIIQNSGDDLPTLIMNYGLVQLSGAITSYKPFFEAIKQDNSKKVIRVYKDLEGDNFNKFHDEILEILELLDNKYFLLIVDKVLANNKDGNEIIFELRKRLKDTHTFFSILFTSYPEKELQLPVDPLHFEVQKQENEEASLEQVSQGLALCAYGLFFEELFNLNRSALEYAKDLILISGKENMLYLAGMAKAEGETVFNTINNWFSLLVQKRVNDRLFHKTEDTLDFDFIAGLTSLIDSDFWGNFTEDVSPDFRNEVQELSRYELFDYHVNSTFSPPAPGDIYRIGSEIYILTGQECDLVVRDDGKSVCRKDALAEMVKCKFIPKLLDSKINENNSSISFNYFLLENNLGSLLVKFSDRSFFDFRILDLCSLNENGESKYSKDGQIASLIERALPKMWLDYRPALLGELTEKIKVYEFLEKENIGQDLFADLSFSIKPTIDDTTVSFEVKRIARLKDKFKEYFLRRFWEHKTRMGLNTIALSKRDPVTVNSIKYGYFSNLKKVETPFTAWWYSSDLREKNRNKGRLPLILAKESIVANLGNDFKVKVEAAFTDEIILHSNEFIDDATQIIFSKSYETEKLSIEIIFPYHNQITGTYFKGKEKMLLKDIFTQEYIDNLGIEIGTTYNINGSDFSLVNNQGHFQRIPLEHLEQGVIIESIGFGFRLDKETGILSQIELDKGKDGEQQE